MKITKITENIPKNDCALELVKNLGQERIVLLFALLAVVLICPPLFAMSPFKRLEIFSATITAQDAKTRSGLKIARYLQLYDRLFGIISSFSSSF